jgi:predicted transcriptional regulator
MGKTTAMQGIIWEGIQQKRIGNAIPLNIVVSGAMTANNPKELADNFHRALLLGVGRLAMAKNRKKEILDGLKRYAPWVAKKATEAVGIIFGPVALASDLAEKGVKWLVKKFDYENIEALLTSKDVDLERASSILLEKLESDGKTLFIIDELDKVKDDVILSDFFDGNQSWFQGRNAIISLSYTFGQALKDTLLVSASRISTIEPFPGIGSLTDAKDIIRRRVMLGLSQIEETEESASQVAEQIFPDGTINALLNVSAPNIYILLERASQALDRAIASNSTAVLPDHVYKEPLEKSQASEIERMILERLVNTGRLSTMDLAEQLNRNKGQISKVLTRMMTKGWVNRIGAGKRAYYYITPKGESSLRRTDNS